ncbi:zinc finger protein 622 [Cimex lectularius]|uniref:C2H2-type domain-containing protein n=1 Tax=Cimex lectularius TaxID=79782 RepID=A0A8I6R673_CIMLE|nr:zinc finger protein 622 [Cimex lectularius]
MSNSFTCISCRVAFASAEIQRQHYKTDWHRYNLKRKVVHLPPVTAEDFELRVIQQRLNNEENSKDTSTFCKICRKAFSCNKAFENHLNSKKHKEKFTLANSENEETHGLNSISEPAKPKEYKERESKRHPEIEDEQTNIEEYSDIEEVDSDEWDDMEDVEEMEEISENNPILKDNCLFCAHHSPSMEENLNHMFIDHSFFIPDKSFNVDLMGLLLHLGEKVCKYYMCLWCNFRGKEFYSMEAAQTHMRDKGHCKILYEGPTVAEYSHYYNYATSYPDHNDEVNIDEEIENMELDGSDYQLALPSGATIGHRSLLPYYRQRLGPITPVTRSKNFKSYKVVQWKETNQALARRMKDTKRMTLIQGKFYMQVGVKANKLQKHFRPQVNF